MWALLSLKLPGTKWQLGFSSKMIQKGKSFHISIFLLSFLVFPFQVVISQIQLGSKLSVAQTSFWVSSNGDFALGFYNHSVLPNRFSIGIRFNSKSIPPDKQTVVWITGADATVSNDSYFEFTKNGELVLFDSLLGSQVWSSNTGQLSVSSALLRDDGNLVLLNKKQNIVWQSFDTPADTLLPNQKLESPKLLRAASKSAISSYYSLHMVESGQLELRWESNITFWRSKNLNSNNISLVLTSNGALLLRGQDMKPKPVWSAFGEDHDEKVKFRFVRLDVDGNLRIYSWNEVLGIWKPVWQAVENQCDVFATCGEQICSFNSSGSAECKCPFKFPSESNPKKCLAPYTPGCKSGSTMVEFKHMSLYGVYPANDSIYITSLEKCKKICMDDPSCTSVTYMNDGSANCGVKLTRYVSGYSDPSLSSSSFVKRCSDPVAVDPNVDSASTNLPSNSIKVRSLFGAATATSVLFLGIQLGILLYVYKRSTRVKQKGSSLSIGRVPKGLIALSFNEIKEITENFKHKIGQDIFKGVLFENQRVAVKEMEDFLEERKFRCAVSKIGSIHHKNLLKLEAYCCDSGRRYLVYEYAKHGSLDRFLEDPAKSKKLSWRKRFYICLSVAKALCYLHTGCREFVSHGNVSCKNAVLDEDFEAKLSEFGFVSCSADVDVQGFGKLALRLVSGCCEEAEETYEWAYGEWIGGRKQNVLDKRIEGGFDSDQLEIVLRIAFWCVQEDQRMRPSMGEVVKVLEGTLSVDPAPPPFGCRRTPSSDSSGSASEP